MDPWGYQSYQVRWDAAKNELLATLRAEQRPEVTSHFPFEKLPPEIRNAIYHLHLVQAEDLTRLRKWDDRLEARAYKVVHYKLHHPNYKPPLFEYTALSILGASRQLQHEALGIFYYHNTFRFQRVTDLRDFLSSIGSRRRAFIRDIQFYYCGTAPAAAFKLLATCKNLTKLQIRTSCLTLSGSKRNLLEARGFGQLLKIRGLETVEILDPQYFPYSNKQGFKDAVRNALLQPRKAIKEKKRAADSKPASRGKNVAAKKKRTIGDGEAQKTKKTKLSHGKDQSAN